MKIPNGTYAEYAAGAPATVATPVLTVTTGSQFLGLLGNDRVFTTVYEVTTNNSSTGVTAALADKTSTPVGDGHYVTANEKIVLTFPAGAAYYKVSIDGVDTYVTVGASGLTRQFVASNTVTVTKVSDYMSASDIQTILSGYDSTDYAGAQNCTVSVNGNTVTLTVNSGSNIAQVSGTGLGTLAQQVLEHNSAVVSFASGDAVSLAKGTQSGDVKTALASALAKQTLPTTVTVTITNADSGESVVAYLEIAQAQA